MIVTFRSSEEIESWYWAVCKRPADTSGMYWMYLFWGPMRAIWIHMVLLAIVYDRRKWHWFWPGFLPWKLPHLAKLQWCNYLFIYMQLHQCNYKVKHILLNMLAAVTKNLRMTLHACCLLGSHKHATSVCAGFWRFALCSPEAFVRSWGRLVRNPSGKVVPWSSVNWTFKLSTFLFVADSSARPHVPAVQRERAEQSGFESQGI